MQQEARFSLEFLRAVLAWCVFGAGVFWAGWLYTSPPVISLRYEGPAVTCYALGPDRLPNIEPGLDKGAHDAVEDYLFTWLRVGGLSSEDQADRREQVAGGVVAGCQEARSNRQASLMLVTAGTIAAFGVSLLATVSARKPQETLISAPPAVEEDDE